VYRDPALPTGLQESPHSPIKKCRLQPPCSGEKRGNLHHKNPERGNVSSIPLSEEYCWSSRGKKTQTNLKTPTTGAQGIKTLTKNNSRCINLNRE
jgi:hypothetical protein